jgi:plastocyanin
MFVRAPRRSLPKRAPKEVALSRSYRRVLLPVLLVASLALAACGSSGGSGAGDTKTAVGGKIDVNAKDPYSFDVKTINATAGPLTVTLHEKGSQTHTFTIPSEKFEIKVTPSTPTATGTVTLQAGKTYDFKCSYDGHAAAGMTGKIVVS